jgi:hypothetical protein
MDTDYDSFKQLWEDITVFVNEHQDHEIICADYPGGGFVTPRLGWQALNINGEKIKEWTLAVDHIKDAPDKIKESLKSYDGKMNMIKSLKNK